MKETIAMIGDMSCAKKTLMQWLEEEIGKGKDCFDCEAAGEVTDMIKDLAEAEEKCMKKKYYELIVCEMMKYDDDLGDIARMGYDNWRYASGKFAPTGHGHRTGYMPWPPYHDMEIPMNPNEDEMRLGYPHMSGSSSTGDTHRRMPHMGGRMGYTMDEDWQRNPSRKGTAYDEFNRARRHYHESKDQNSMMEMNHKIEEASHEAIEGIREMWKEGSPEVKKKIKTNLTELLEETK